MATRVPSTVPSAGRTPPSGSNNEVSAEELNGMLQTFVLNGGNIDEISLPGVRSTDRASAPASAPAPAPLPEEIRKPLSATIPKFKGDVATFHNWLVEFEIFANHQAFHGALTTREHIPVARRDGNGGLRNAEECEDLGHSRAEIRCALNAWQALMQASTNETFRSILLGQTSPSEGYAALQDFYNMKSTDDRGVYLPQVLNAKLRKNQSPLDLWEWMRKVHRLVPDGDKVTDRSL